MLKTGDDKPPPYSFETTHSSVPLLTPDSHHQSNRTVVPDWHKSKVAHPRQPIKCRLCIDSMPNYDTSWTEEQLKATYRWEGNTKVYHCYPAYIEG